MTLPGYFAGKLSWDITTTQVNSALHPSGVAKSSTSFGRGKGGKVTSAGWQVTLCDLIWHVISRSGVVISITNCYIRFTLLYFTLLSSWAKLTAVASETRCGVYRKKAIYVIFSERSRYFFRDEDLNDARELKRESDYTLSCRVIAY